MHRLDQISRRKPANLFDYRSLTLRATVQTDWPVYFFKASKWITSGSPTNWTTRKVDATSEFRPHAGKPSLLRASLTAGEWLIVVANTVLGASWDHAGVEDANAMVLRLCNHNTQAAEDKNVSFCKVGNATIITSR